jgi:lysophospholipase L1-like esterase
MIKDSAKTIVCYGDSNTWGTNAGSYTRLPRSIRWTGVLQNLLGDDFEVISEGLSGRTFVATNPTHPQKTGITHLQAILETHDPIDLLIIMLGTNDVKNTFNLSTEDIASHLEQTIELVNDKKTDLEKRPKILVICPPPVIPPEGGELDPRMANGPELFKKLPELFKKVAEKYNCAFLNGGDYISNGKVDGYHLDEVGNKRLAEVLAQWILKQ